MDNCENSGCTQGQTWTKASETFQIDRFNAALALVLFALNRYDELCVNSTRLRPTKILTS